MKLIKRTFWVVAILICVWVMASFIEVNSKNLDGEHINSLNFFEVFTQEG